MVDCTAYTLEKVEFSILAKFIYVIAAYRTLSGEIL